MGASQFESIKAAGGAEPSAWLDVKAGTTLKAGMRLLAGLLLSTPLDGAVEYDGSCFYLTDSAGIRRTIAFVDTAARTTNVVTADQTMVVNNRYIVQTNDVTLTLPAVSAVGDELLIMGNTSGKKWKIAQGAGQSIGLGNVTTTAGTGGYLESTAEGDAVRLVCVEANLKWRAESVIGNITYV